MRRFTGKKNAFFVPVVRRGPTRSARLERLRRWSFACMLLVAMVAVTGVTMQTVKIYEILAANKNIKEIYLDREILATQTENLKIELELEKRDEVICHLASQTLGMIHPEKSQIVVLPGYAGGSENILINAWNSPQK